MGLGIGLGDQRDRRFEPVRDDSAIARVQNFLICKAAFEKALFVYPDAHLEMRQGARIILKSKEEPPC
jgi:hypothetical protein